VVMTVGLRPGEVAAAAGVNRETLRYYERRGIVAKPARTVGGHRMYPPETVTTVRTIKAAQRLGFTLSEIEELLGADVRRRPGSGLEDRATAKLAEVEQNIADLTVIARTLRGAIQAGCDDLAECAATERCPIPFAGGDSAS